MSQELQKITQDDLQVLEQAGVIPKGTPESQVKLFAKVCAEKGLSPFSKQIHLIPRRSSNGMQYTFQTSIDGYRLIAERTGKYAGSDDYVFDEGLTEYEMLKAGRNRPTTATATVYKILPNGQTFPIKATARWDEYYPGDRLGFMWKKMSFLMLGKCSEALALRKAFPEALGGIYTKEEMQQADKPEVTEVNAELLEKMEIEISSFEDANELKEKALGIVSYWKQQGLPENVTQDYIKKHYRKLVGQK